jgi:hypothetical protein
MARPVILAGVIGALLLTGACKGGAEEKKVTQRQQIGQSWKYETEKAPGSGREIPVAYIGSANSVRTMSAPDTFAVVLLQKMRNGETGVTVKAVGAPFTCDLSDCSVEASVDGGSTKTWKGRLTDNKDGITIPPSQNAFDTLKKGKLLRITLNLGPEGAHPFDFKTEGLKWPG